MIHLKRHLSPDSPPADDLREQVKAAVARVKQDPNDVVALLRLTHLYSQLWLKSDQDEIVPRILQCLTRAVKLDDGAYATQIGKLVQSLDSHLTRKHLSEALTQLRTLQNQLNAQKETHKEPEQAPAPAVEPSSATSEEEEAGGEDLPVPEVSPDELVALGPKTAEETGPGSTEEPSSPDIHMDLKVETVAPAPEEKVDKRQMAKVRREQQHQAALAAAEELSEAKQYFEEERVEDILKLYAAAMEAREKRYIAEELAARIPEWGVGPMLAIAALESDEQVFRRIMRLILKADRAAICEEIELETYSTDLQRVAAVVLSELGIRPALAKMHAALELPDPVVRSVAVHGLGRAGKAAQQYIPDLVIATESDPHNNVRRAAAKALNEMGIPEAWEALEAAANKTTFDSTIYIELEKMRKRYGASEKSGKGKDKAVGPAAAASDKPQSQGLSPTAKKNLTKAIVYIIILVVACIFLWKQIAPYIIPPDYGPPGR